MFVYGSLRARVLTVVGLTLVPSFVVFAVLHPMSVERNAADTVLRLLGGGMLSLAVAWVSTSSMITRPAERVVLAARRLRDGDVTARASFRDHSEIGEMARAFDELADALRAREQQLETLNAELEERVTHRSAALERANGELSLSRTELRRLSHELLEIVEKERLRLSREVHDQIGQVLTGIKMDVAAARRRLDAADVPGARQRLDTAMETVDEAVHLARQIALNLRPSLLDDCGLTGGRRMAARGVRPPHRDPLPPELRHGRRPHPAAVGDDGVPDPRGGADEHRPARRRVVRRRPSGDGRDAPDVDGERRWPGDHRAGAGRAAVAGSARDARADAPGGRNDLGRRLGRPRHGRDDGAAARASRPSR